MPSHEDADVMFDVPRDWDNRTLVAYAAPLAPGQTAAANIVMTREKLPKDETLDSYADKQVEELAERLDGFELIHHSETTVDGRPALSFWFGSRGAQNVSYEQRLVIVHAPGQRLLSFTMTSPEEDAEAMEPLFERILGSVKLKALEGEA